ncbi:Uncharacterised protein [Mycobacterium tuberculosis]|nr:Uncharacterised protein [Mycobacterium tuberculosis]
MTATEEPTTSSAEHSASMASLRALRSAGTDSPKYTTSGLRRVEPQAMQGTI